ncbi:hypothetical protein AS850_00315 [Frondihabitans sp. 762G35]|nr:hypothetical protein AS850_00315 [Frondihabitans sp. 762G35]
MLGAFIFADPDGGQLRRVNVDDADTESGYEVTPAGRQAHLPNTGAYVDEADRLLRALLTALEERDDAECDGPNGIGAAHELG